MKRTFKQLLKKTVLAVTATSMLVSALPAVGFAATAADPVVWNYDYNSSGSHFGTNATPPVEHSGNAQKFDKHSTATANDQWGSSYMQGPAFAETGSGETAANSNTSTDPYVVSFDFMLTSTAQNYKFMLRDWPSNTAKTDDQGNTTYSKQTNDFAFVNFVDGHIYLDKAASGKSVLDPNFADTMYDAGAYTPNKWYNISMYVTPGEAGTTTIDYYIDGAYVYGADSSVRTKSNGILFTSYLGVLTTKDAEGNYVAPTEGEFWVDNFMMQYASSTYYTKLTHSEPVVDGQNISVDFIEPVRTDGYSMSDIKLYNSDNTEVTGTTAAVSGKTLKITGAALTNGAKYHIALPAAFKGVSGVNPESDVISFVNGAEARVNGEVAWVTDQNFTGNTKGFIDQNNTINNKQLENGNYVVTFSQEASTTNQWQAAISDLTTVVPVDKSFLDKDYNMSDIFVMSADYYFPKGTGTDVISGTGVITTKLEGKNAAFMKYKFTNDGRFICSSMNADNSWSEKISVNIEAEKWYTVKSVISKENKYVDYYLCKEGENEKYIGTTYFNTDQINNEATCIRTIYGHLSGNSTDGWIGGNYYIDNIKAGYILNTDYLKVVDSQPESADSHTITEGKSIRTGKTYMVDFDVTPANLSDAGVEFSIKGTAGNRNIIFKMYKDGTLKMSNGSIDAWSDSYTYTLPISGISDGKTFNVKVYFDNDIVVSNTAAERRRRAYLYIDDVFTRAFALGNGNETGDYSSSLDLSTLFFTTVTGSANAKISNFKLGYTSKIPYVDSAVIYNQNDAVGHAFVSHNIKSDVEKIVLNVADTSYASNGTLTAGTATLTNDNDTTIELDAAVGEDSSQIVLTTKNGAYVPNGKWTLNYTGSADCSDYTATFTVNETRDMIDNSSFTFDADTKTATLGGSVQNFKEEKTISVIIAEYTSSNPKQLVKIFTKDVTLSTGDNNLSELPEKLTLTGTSTDSANYKAFIWDSVSGMVPIVSAKTVQ